MTSQLALDLPKPPTSVTARRACTYCARRYVTAVGYPAPDVCPACGAALDEDRAA